MACFDFGAFSLLIERDIHVELALQLFALFFFIKKKKNARRLNVAILLGCNHSNTRSGLGAVVQNYCTIWVVLGNKK
jgi:hypothetical protein